MKPDTASRDQVVARVVAWHNRHPLATRISADQVHSVGVVSLPFAVQGAQVQPVALPPPADAAAGATNDTILDRALDADAQADAVAPTRVQWRVSGLPPRTGRWTLKDAWRRLRGADPYRALFSEDFIAPLRPARVARWAARHGQADWPLERGAEQRMVMLDASRRRTGDSAPELDLHLITAAIGVGDDRLRLLLAPAPGGMPAAVLGRRHWSRQRVATAVPMMLGLVLAIGAGLHARWPADAVPLIARMGGPGGAASAAASAPATELAAASAASAAASAASALLAASAASPASAGSTALALLPTRPQPAEPEAQPSEPAEEILPPPSVEPRRGRVDLPPLPRLADAERQARREDASQLRQEPVQQVKAWALVTGTLTSKRQSERVAAQLQAVALLQPVPMRAELMPTGEGWRAVFWPFTSERDAEKVRLALADKGLRTEVLEF